MSKEKSCLFQDKRLIILWVKMSCKARRSNNSMQGGQAEFQRFCSWVPFALWMEKMWWLQTYSPSVSLDANTQTTYIFLTHGVSTGRNWTCNQLFKHTLRSHRNLEERNGRVWAWLNPDMLYLQFLLCDLKPDSLPNTQVAYNSNNEKKQRV